MSDDYTPGEFWSGFGKWIGTVAALAIIGGLVILVGWRVGWWFTAQNATRSYHQARGRTGGCADSCREDFAASERCGILAR